MLKKKNYYAVDRVVSFIESFADKSLGLERRFELDLVAVEYSHIVNTKPADRKDEFLSRKRADNDTV